MTLDDMEAEETDAVELFDEVDCSVLLQATAKTKIHSIVINGGILNVL